MATSDGWPQTHETLIGRLQANCNGAAWEIFVEIYSPLIYRFCRRRGVQDADSLDVTQNVFVAVRRGINGFTYDPERGKFRSWLGTITIREIGRYLQSLKRAGTPTEAATEGRAQVDESDAIWIAIFNEHIGDVALARIRPEFEVKTWEAFELLWKHHKSPSEVAQLMEKSADWVYQVKYRVLRKLEKEVLLLTADIPSFTKDS